MKRFLLSVFTIILCLNAFGQRKVDLVVTLLSPPSGDNIGSLQGFNVKLEYKNNGPDSLIKGDSLLFEYSYGSATSQTVVSQSQTILIFNKTFPKGDTGSITFKPISFTDTVLGTSSLYICGEMYAYVVHKYQADSLKITGDSTVSCNAVTITGSGIEATARLGGKVDVYPNPANESTTFSYETTSYGSVNLALYDMDGKMVSTIVSDEQPAGKYTYNLNTANLKPGVYIYKFASENDFVSGKVIIAR